MRSLLAAGLLVLGTASVRAADPAPPCPCAAAAPDLSGHWVGYWISDKNGHHGPLRASVRPTADGRYRFLFAGRFWKVIPFVYAVTLTVTEVRGDAVTLAGELNLGPGLGTFRCDAVATATHFDARFAAKGDSGRFVLDRPVR